jgi:hypothetical protein
MGFVVCSDDVQKEECTKNFKMAANDAPTSQSTARTCARHDNATMTKKPDRREADEREQKENVFYDTTTLVANSPRHPEMDPTKDAPLIQVKFRFSFLTF